MEVEGNEDGVVLAAELDDGASTRFRPALDVHVRLDRAAWSLLAPFGWDLEPPGDHRPRSVAGGPKRDVTAAVGGDATALARAESQPSIAPCGPSTRFRAMWASRCVRHWWALGP